MNAHLHARDSPRDACQLSLTRGPEVYLIRLLTSQETISCARSCNTRHTFCPITC